MEWGGDDNISGDTTSELKGDEVSQNISGGGIGEHDKESDKLLSTSKIKLGNESISLVRGTGEHKQSGEFSQDDFSDNVS